MNYLAAYIRFLKRALRARAPLRVVFDCSNGTTGAVLARLFTRTRIRAHLLNRAPDGNFPAHGPNPLAPGAQDQLRRAVRARRADLGVIFDADGDRVFFVDDRGNPVSSDAIAALIAANFSGPVLVDPRVGYLARGLLKAARRRVIECRVGHYFIKRMMRAKKIRFSAEFSGHYYFPVEGAYFDAAILAALYVINQVARVRARGSSLSAWLDSLPRTYHSGELNFNVSNASAVIARIERAYRTRAARVSKRDGLKMEFSPSTSARRASAWWFLVRPSNTEPVLRLMVEAKNERLFRAQLTQLTRLITSR